MVATKMPFSQVIAFLSVRLPLYKHFPAANMHRVLMLVVR